VLHGSPEKVQDYESETCVAADPLKVCTMDLTAERDRILQAEWKRFVMGPVGTEVWLNAFEYRRSDAEIISFFTALAPTARADKLLTDPSWDLPIGGGMPSTVTYFAPGKEDTRYLRFGNDDGVEPLVLVREFHGVRPSCIELSEEFRLFHNLYFDAPTGTYLKIDDNGDEEEVASIKEDLARIKLREVREFISAKEMCLVVMFDIDQMSSLSLDELKIPVSDEKHQGNDIVYRFGISRFDFEEAETASKLIGKRLIFGLQGYQLDASRLRCKKEYVSFIIRTDPEGNNVSYSCDPDGLANFFGANPGAPNYLTPVFFRREVLAKYYANPEKYSVEDAHLRCGYLWGLRMDNNHDKFVTVFLGDLGRDLSYKEQLYWRSFNVAPEGGISAVTFRRSFLAEFADPEKPDLIFKSVFDSFRKRWEQRFGWPLFKPLSANNRHSLIALHVPLTTDQAEFDSQVLALARVLIESLNEVKIVESLPERDPNAKGISKLEKFLAAQGLIGFHEHIKFLRDLHDLRHGAGHRKGHSFERAARSFGLRKMDSRVVFEDLLGKSVELLRYLDSKLLGDTAPAD
jgi:hypothetical protein